jgi:hypothetical protein
MKGYFGVLFGYVFLKNEVKRFMYQGWILLNTDMTTLDLFQVCKRWVIFLFDMILDLDCTCLVEKPNACICVTMLYNVMKNLINYPFIVS